MIRLYKPQIVVRPLAAAHVPYIVRAVGPVVDRLYPRGRELFTARLGEVIGGKARCTVAWRNGHVIGVAVETPKGSHRLKLSTLWVHPLWRRRQVGTTLLRTVSERWLLQELDRVHLTVSLGEYAGILGLLRHFGFEHLTLERNRYGQGRDEAVLIWTPDSFLNSAQGSPTRSASHATPGSTFLSLPLLHTAAA